MDELNHNNADSPAAALFSPPYRSGDPFFEAVLEMDPPTEGGTVPPSSWLKDAEPLSPPQLSSAPPNEMFGENSSTMDFVDDSSTLAHQENSVYSSFDTIFPPTGFPHSVPDSYHEHERSSEYDVVAPEPEEFFRDSHNPSELYMSPNDLTLTGRSDPQLNAEIVHDVDTNAEDSSHPLLQSPSLSPNINLSSNALRLTCRTSKNTSTTRGQKRVLSNTEDGRPKNRRNCRRSKRNNNILYRPVAGATIQIVSDSDPSDSDYSDSSSSSRDRRRHRHRSNFALDGPSAPDLQLDWLSSSSSDSESDNDSSVEVLGEMRHSKRPVSVVDLTRESDEEVADVSANNSSASYNNSSNNRDTGDSSTAINRPFGHGSLLRSLMPAALRQISDEEDGPITSNSNQINNRVSTSDTNCVHNSLGAAGLGASASSFSSDDPSHDSDSHHRQRECPRHNTSHNSNRNREYCCCCRESESYNPSAVYSRISQSRQMLQSLNNNNIPVVTNDSAHDSGSVIEQLTSVPNSSTLNQQTNAPGGTRLFNDPSLVNMTDNSLSQSAGLNGSDSANTEANSLSTNNESASNNSFMSRLPFGQTSPMINVSAPQLPTQQPTGFFSTGGSRHSSSAGRGIDTVLPQPLHYHHHHHYHSPQYPQQPNSYMNSAALARIPPHQQRLWLSQQRSAEMNRRRMDPVFAATAGAQSLVIPMPRPHHQGSHRRTCLNVHGGGNNNGSGTLNNSNDNAESLFTSIMGSRSHRVAVPNFLSVASTGGGSAATAGGNSSFEINNDPIVTGGSNDSSLNPLLDDPMSGSFHQQPPAPPPTPPAYQLPSLTTPANLPPIVNEISGDPIMPPVITGPINIVIQSSE